MYYYNDLEINQVCSVNGTSLPLERGSFVNLNFPNVSRAKNALSSFIKNLKPGSSNCGYIRIDVYLFNARSLKNKTNKFRHYLSENSGSVFAVIET